MDGAAKNCSCEKGGPRIRPKAGPRGKSLTRQAPPPCPPPAARPGHGGGGRRRGKKWRKRRRRRKRKRRKRKRSQQPKGNAQARLSGCSRPAASLLLCLFLFPAPGRAFALSMLVPASDPTPDGPTPTRGSSCRMAGGRAGTYCTTQAPVGTWCTQPPRARRGTPYLAGLGQLSRRPSLVLPTQGTLSHRSDVHHVCWAC